MDFIVLPSCLCVHRFVGAGPVDLRCEVSGQPTVKTVNSFTQNTCLSIISFLTRGYSLLAVRQAIEMFGPKGFQVDGKAPAAVNGAFSFLKDYENHMDSKSWLFSMGV